MSRSIVVKPIPHISTPMLGVAVSLLLCCGLLPTSSNAALVTLQGNYLSYDHFDQSSGDYDGLFVFTYEDSTPDTNPNPDRGTYDNPIISAQITLSKPTKPDILLVLDPSSGTHIATDTIQRSINVNIEARFIESGSNILYDLAVRIETYTLPNDGLSSLIGMRREDSCASSLRRTDGGSSQFSGFCEKFHSPFTLVPIPPAVWLFGSTLGLMGVIRRKAQTATSATLVS